MVTDIHGVLQNMRGVSGAHKPYPEFFSCGDAQGYQQGLQGKRGELRQPGSQQFPEEGAS
jgi:hypothetical protein